jgi:hypothetical protein
VRSQELEVNEANHKIRLFCFKGLILSSKRKNLSKELRKKKKKYANVIMLLFILFVLFFIVLQDKSIKVSTDELVNSYSLDVSTSDKRFLNKDIELTAEIKSYLQFESDKSLLELGTMNDEIKLFCILINKETEAKASTLTAGTSVTVYGKCLGIKNSKFPNSIYIEAEQIK